MGDGVNPETRPASRMRQCAQSVPPPAMQSTDQPSPDDLIPLLKTSGSLRGMSEPLLQLFAAALRCREVAAGEAVFREGETSASLVIVLNGRLRVSRTSPSGELQLYNELGAGDMQGEASLMLEQPRPADLTAVRDSLIAELDLPAFEGLLRAEPVGFHRVFAQALVRYLRHAPPVVEKHRAQTILLQPLFAGEELAQLTRRLARELEQALAAVGRVALLQAEGATAGEADLERARAQLGRLEAEHDYLLLQAEAAPSAWTRLLLSRADHVLFLAQPGQSPLEGALERRLREEPGFSFKRQHLALLHPAEGPLPGSPLPWRKERAQLERVVAVRAGRADDVARLSRLLTGRAVGVVLGGGGARGFAHLGVLRAMAEAGIPIDLLGGNSMGALIGSQIALGYPLESIRDRILGFVAGGERPTLPMVSLLSGGRMERNLRQLCKVGAHEPLVDGLWTPFFTAACNLSRACTTVLDEGPLWRAVLASNSPAGLLPPVPYNGELLVDGAILDNVPVEAMRLRLGAKLERRRGNGTVIAIDVDVAEPLQVEEDRERIRLGDKLRSSFGGREPPMPGIGQILYRAGHIGGMAQRQKTIAQSDFYLEPPTSDFSLMGYKRADEIIERGYEYARGQIAHWDRRLLPPLPVPSGA